MNPALIIPLTSAAIDLVEKLVLIVQEARSKGEITDEEQQALLDRIDSLRARAGGEFQGEHWVPSTSSTP